MGNFVDDSVVSHIRVLLKLPDQVDAGRACFQGRFNREARLIVRVERERNGQNTSGVGLSEDVWCR